MRFFPLLLPFFWLADWLVGWLATDLVPAEAVADAMVVVDGADVCVYHQAVPARRRGAL